MSGKYANCGRLRCVYGLAFLILVASSALASENYLNDTNYAAYIESLNVKEEPVVVETVIESIEEPIDTNSLAESYIDAEPVSAEFTKTRVAIPQDSYIADDFNVQSRTWTDGAEEQIIGASFISIASGLYYRDRLGEWSTSSAFPETGKDGAVFFSKQAVKRCFAANCGQESVVVSDHHGELSQSAVAGLSYYDTESGKSVIIGVMQSSPVQTHSEGVYYADAFSGVDADIVYKLHNWGVEQDVIIYGDLPHPSSYGFDEKSTWLCVLTELVDADLSELTVIRNEKILPGERSTAPLRIYKDKTRLYNFQQGYAFAVEDAKSPAYVMGGEGGKARNLVHMRMFTVGGRVFVSEEIPLHNLVKGIPSAYASTKQVACLDLPEFGAVQSGDPLPPERPVNKQELLVEEEPAESPARQISDEDEEMDVIATLIPPYEARGHHYVIDYIDRSGSTTNDLVFETGETYYIKDDGLFLSGGTLTLEPGCIVLFTNTARIVLEDGAQIICDSCANDQIMRPNFAKNWVTHCNWVSELKPRRSVTSEDEEKQSGPREKEAESISA